ncbi:MAG TPA: thiosulfate sulfurtransferase [Candidatus Flavonifractor merdigallinarum]|uniref:Thiosulfate sulfurtransferase n=1 Tax=Candidatus Flavonifractor merdigallinarum TaxID=2838589 RepID=A0A9D2BY03_9FIRM|nr:thiosulfate sulfurtransferase [Candidatus Flavonifractor merdigallinarum]
MKRNTRVLVAGTLLVGLLAGCGGQTQSSAAPAASPSAQPSAGQEGSYPTVTTTDVQAALEDSSSVVVDARINSAYIGWTLEGVERGGHIPGATDFSARWLTSTYSDTDNLEGETRAQVLEQYLENKGIDSSKKVIVYDANGTDAQAVADYFTSQGVTDVSLYDVNEWASDESLEMESYANYSLLVPAENVKALIDGQTPETFEEGVEYKFFDVAWGEVDQSGYLDGHVPGAVHVNTDWFEPEEINWMLADDDTLLALMLKLGITAQDHIVVTGPEPMAACRFAVILKYMGVDDVRVMTGGLVEWSDLGYELATDNVEPVAVDSFGVDTPANPDWIDTQDEVAEMLTQDNFTLVDNRTWEEFIGESTGYSYHDKAGRIPGAVFGYAGKVSSSSVCYYRNIDKTMRNADEILAMWESCGIDPETHHLSFMCGSGWRAAEILWYARVMGYENTSLYSDGWIGWSNAGRPTETGDPTAK